MYPRHITHRRKRRYSTSMQSRRGGTSRFSSSCRAYAQRVRAPCLHHVREKLLQNLDIRSITENKYRNPNIHCSLSILSKVCFFQIVDPIMSIAMLPPHSLSFHPHRSKAGNFSLTLNALSSLDHLTVYHRIHERACQNRKSPT